MHRLGRAAYSAAIASTMVLGLATALTSAPAQAGSNGQQAEIVTYTGYSGTINGCNQNNVCFTTSCIPLPLVYNKINGYWWVGRTVVRIFPTSDCSGPDNGGLSEVVPRNQPGNDYWIFNFAPS